MDIRQIIITVLEIAGTISFAVSGAMTAMEKKVDLFGVLFLGIVTALGGGIIRDITIGKVPPSAFENGKYMMLAAATALIVFFIAWFASEHYQNNVEILNAVNNIFDAAGLGIFTVIGMKTAIATGYGHNAFFTIFLGMVTGIGGGIIRDLMIREIPFVLRKRIYALASLFGGVIYYIFLRMNINDLIAVLISAGATFGLRMLATFFKWNLPKAFE